MELDWRKGGGGVSVGVVVWGVEGVGVEGMVDGGCKRDEMGRDRWVLLVRRMGCARWVGKKRRRQWEQTYRCVVYKVRGVRVSVVVIIVWVIGNWW